MTGRQARAQVWGRPRGRSGIDVNRHGYHRYSPARTRELGQPSIGIRLKDQNGKPISGSRLRVKLPDGKTKEGTTNADGELEITGFTVDGNAQITLLDHTKPGKAEAPKWPEEKEFKVTVVDEIGNPVSGIWMQFRHGSASNLVITDGDGVATYTTSDADSVNVSFESSDALAQVMKPMWTPSRQTDRKDWVPADDTTTVVTVYGGDVVKVIADQSTTSTTRPKETLEPFYGVETTLGKPATLSVQPLVIFVRMLGEHFDTDKCFLQPKALDSIQDLIRLHKEYALTDLLIIGHTDTDATDAYNLDLSLQRTSAMRAYLTNDADSWLEWYGDDKKQSKRWGVTEDTFMIGTLLAGTQYSPTVLGYQQWHNAEAPRLKSYEDLEEDGQIGPVTRKQLILDYMHREDTTVPGGTAIAVHGCSEFFPLGKDEEHVDPTAPDNDEEQRNRRVEVFLFPREIGMLPPVPGEKATRGEQEYPEWRRRSIDFDLLSEIEFSLKVRLHDDVANVMSNTLFRFRVGLQGSWSAESQSDDSGWAVLTSSTPLQVPSLQIEWDLIIRDPDTYRYRRDVNVQCDPKGSAASAWQCLQNLGYQQETFDAATEAFQKDYRIQESGYGSTTMEALRKIYQDRQCDAKRPGN